LILLKNNNQIQSIDFACKIVRDTLLHIEEQIVPDISTLDLDKMAEEFILSSGGTPGFKGLYGFPGTLCVSIEDEVVHGVPSKRLLNEGEIISIDVGSIYNDYYGDHAKTFPVGEVDDARNKLLDVTKKSLELGIHEVKDGKYIGDIGHAIQTFAEKNNFSVVKDLVGHGIGKTLHEEPQIPNFGLPNTGPEIKVGMCLAIEPMLNQGSDKIITKDDGWTISTSDGKLSAHFEHTVAVTEKGVKILTV
tara:strand:- start:1160 stop:1903 length:744 start_codon:yes stop_codon:yes gene_type:complete